MSFLFNFSFILAILIVTLYYCKETIGQSVPVRGKIIWSDEFDYEGPPSRNDWIQETGGGGWGNQEAQYYTDSNAYVSDGKLTITAKKEYKDQNQYTSARLISKREFKYGVIEARMKLPAGRGTWPAFWLLASKKPLNWPSDGEIDVLEHVGFDPGRVHANIHCLKFNHLAGSNIGNNTFINDLFSDFHTYTVDWNSKRLLFYIDDLEYFRYYKVDDSYDYWPFDNPHNIILNLVIGGQWGAILGIDDSIFPVGLVIDYVRQYEVNEQDDDIKLVRIKSSLSNKFLTADRYGSTPLFANREQPAYSETFRMIKDPNDENKFSLISLINNLVVTTDQSDWLLVKKKWIEGDTEKFELVKNPDSSYAIKSVSNGKFFHTAISNSQILANEESANSTAEVFYITYI